jgi:hypothetical protein
MSPEFRMMERVEQLSCPCCECGKESNAYASMCDGSGDHMCEACCNAMRDEANENMPDFEDDGQPTEYEEWQDYMGGDDWDHGQYDDVGFYDE